MSIVLSQVLQVLSSIYLKTIIFLVCFQIVFMEYILFIENHIITSSIPYPKQNNKTKKHPNNIKNKTMDASPEVSRGIRDNNKYKPLPFNNPIFSINLINSISRIMLVVVSSIIINLKWNVCIPMILSLSLSSSISLCISSTAFSNI